MSNFVQNARVKSCSRCVLTDQDDPELKLNDQGICNHCINYDSHIAVQVLSGDAGFKEWNNQVERIKKHGRAKKYDCILGISGGIDSTYLAYIAKQAGLRVLCVHLDNGWNTPEAVCNIKNIIQKLGFDLHTHVLNWEEFKDLQKAYFKAGVIDLDIPTDHAILACLFDQANKNKIKYVLSGHNLVTEAILPVNFNFDKGDAQNLLNIHRKFGTIKLKSFPLFGQKQKYLAKFKRIQFLNPLNWMVFNKTEARKLLEEKLDFQDYGAKHFENIFTRFYQGYILPERFGIDKRKAHLSTLICSGQISRAEALIELEKPCYDSKLFQNDKRFLLNKFNWSETEFEAYMQMPIVAHEEYGVEKPWSHYFGFQFLRKMK